MSRSSLGDYAAVNNQFECRALLVTQNRCVVSQEEGRGGMPPPSSDTEHYYSTYKNFITRTFGFCAAGGGVACPPPPASQNHSFASGRWGGGLPLSPFPHPLSCSDTQLHSRHVCCVTQQACLLCQTADMSAVLCGLLGSCGSPTTGQLGSPSGEEWTSFEP